MIQQLLQLWLDKWRGLFEILLLSVGIYYGYLYFRGTRGAKVLTGLAIVFLTLTLISQLLNLTVIATFRMKVNIEDGRAPVRRLRQDKRHC